MKIYGIGNALVDLEYHVTESFLKEHHLEKGLMTLIDETEHQRLDKILSPHLKRKACGGSAANTMVAIGQFGVSSAYSCLVSNDESGHYFAEDLRANSVRSIAPPKQSELPTGHCHVMITPDADRSMYTFLGATANVSTIELSEEEIKKSDMIYLEGYLLPSPTGKEAAFKAQEIAKKYHKKVAITFSDPNMVNYFKEGFDHLIDHGVDLLFCNESEAMTYTKTDRIESAVDILSKKVKQFAITRGPRGATLFTGTELVQVLPSPAKAVDTNGAGDMFAGAFIAGLAKGFDFKKAGDFASLASAHVVSQYGARLERELASSLLKKF